MTDAGRWTLPDGHAALDRCAARNRQGIRCVLDLLARYARTAPEAQEAVKEHLVITGAIQKAEMKCSLAVKLSTIGAAFDRTLALRNLERLAGEGARKGVALELDMEGRASVDATLRAALACADMGVPVTVAVQACLDRSASDLELISRNGLRPRLVKGAYSGDSADYQDISRRMKALAGTLLSSKRPFAVGTHDPELVGWLEHAAGPSRLEFGFPMGLADDTKLRPASAGRPVREYVPFGPHGAGYITRRRHYLEELERIGKTPAP